MKSLARFKKRNLRIESLEDRRMLANCEVTNFTDAGAFTLRACIAQANDGDMITFADGNHIINLNPAQGPIDIPDDIIIMDMDPAPQDRNGGGPGPTFTPNITVSGVGMTRIFNVDDGSPSSTASVRIEGLTLTNGNGTDGDPMTVHPDDGYGGAILSREQLTLNNVIVTNSSVSKAGGGVLQKAGSIAIKNSNISNNTAAGGGGLASSPKQPTLAPEGTSSSGMIDVLIEDSTIMDNLATSSLSRAFGAGAFIEGTGIVEISGSVISGNTADGMSMDPVPSSGGGLYVNGDSAAMGTLDLSITDTMIDDNQAYQGGGLTSRGRDSALVEISLLGSTVSGNSAGGAGGAIFNFAQANIPGQSRIALTNSTVDGNYATVSAGAIANTVGGDVTIETSTISGNTTPGTGGAIVNVGIALNDPNNHLPSVTINNSTLSGNSAGVSGGAVYSYDADLVVFQSTLSGNTAPTGGAAFLATYGTYVGTAMEGSSDLQSSTITNNSGAFGGGIYTSYYHNTFTLNNSIVAGNYGVGAADLYDNSAAIAVTVSNSLIGDNTGSGLTANGGMPDPQGNKIGDNMNPLDALLSPLADYGGRTHTHTLLVGSPAIDAGDPSIVSGTDQRGFVRVINGVVDMGSTEHGSMFLPTGDFDGDGGADCDDIDELSAQVAAGTTDLTYDLNGDASVNLNDILEWLVIAGARPEHLPATGGHPFLQGDANLDGVVDGQDFLIWNANKFTTNTAWCSGNFNGDANIDGQDFIIWNSNKFTSSSSPSPLDTEATTSHRPTNTAAQQPEAIFASASAHPVESVGVLNRSTIASNQVFVPIRRLHDDFFAALNKTDSDLQGQSALRYLSALSGRPEFS